MNQIVPPQARCRAAAARRDITPPVGIYHRMWGAATHDRATGVHRPLLATALALEAHDGQPVRRVIVGMDHCLMWHDDLERLRQDVCRQAGLAPDELLIAFSHTHGAGLMDRSRSQLPGGELIGPYLDQLAITLADAVREALAGLREATITYGAGRCSLAMNRDQWDPASKQFVCGLDPTAPTDNTLLVARVTSADGRHVAAVVNYACHPTTLAWQNTLISPDYIGALREVVEAAAPGPCLFLLGACGDLGPREGYVGDTRVADRHGRELGYAALSVLESLAPPGQCYQYRGPVVSGATLGDWGYEPLDPAALAAKSTWLCRDWTVAVPYREGLPTREQTQRELDRWNAAERQAQQAGDALQARDCRAQVERMQRQLTRVGQLPPGSDFPLPVSLWQLGDGYWLFLEGEYYHHLQRALRAAFPARTLLVSTVVNGWRPAYLPTRDTYGRGIYQEQVAILAPGCLESVVDAVAAQIEAWETASRQ